MKKATALLLVLCMALTLCACGRSEEAKQADAIIDAMRTMASSRETLVRFQGDDYVKDFTLNSTDKTAMREALEAYDLFVAAGYRGF